MSNHPFTEEICKQGKQHAKGSSPDKMEREECEVIGRGYLEDICGWSSMEVLNLGKKEMVEGEEGSEAETLFSPLAGPQKYNSPFFLLTPSAVLPLQFHRSCYGNMKRN